MGEQPLPQSNVAAFFATVWGKIIGALAIVSMLLGIYVEIVMAYKVTQEAQSAAAEAKANTAITADPHARRTGTASSDRMNEPLTDEVLCRLQAMGLTVEKPPAKCP